MNDSEILPKLIDKLEKDYSLERNTLPAVNDLSAIREHLKKRILQLLAGDYQKFVNSLYMLDVNENKVSEIMSAKNKIEIPDKLADLIIERQLQRIKTQLLYKSGNL
ncbi:MAG: hypothetical protein KF816_00685 [Melioribacteraceae bacterium]|nr:hypothetical protein [Melioribacteraceae bacterium]